VFRLVKAFPMLVDTGNEAINGNYFDIAKQRLSRRNAALTLK
jgi:hypothetical protein